MNDGILIIDKPAGITSHDVIARVRRILKTKRVGHTGTLDPFATGVMVILVGRATRLAQFLDKDAKGYEALVRFGFETDTGDRTGSPKSKVSSLKSEVSSFEIEQVLADFRGELWQTPPMFSAKKIDGKKLYELARQGLEIERKPVKITIYELELFEQPTSLNKQTAPENEQISNPETQNLGPETWDLGLKVLCSAGTYIRVLAGDIGRKIGTGAHLGELRRTAAGKFLIENAVSLEQLEQIHKAGEMEKVLISMNEAVSHLPPLKLDERRVEMTKNGLSSRFETEEIADRQFVRMIDERENLVAVGYFKKDEKIVQPKLVLV